MPDKQVMSGHKFGGVAVRTGPGRRAGHAVHGLCYTVTALVDPLLMAASDRAAAAVAPAIRTIRTIHTRGVAIPRS